MARRAGVVVLAGLIVVLASCGDDGSGGGGDRAGEPDSDAASADGSGPTAAELCAGVEPADGDPTVATDALSEVSGVVASRTQDGVLWAHDDSGGEAAVVAVGETGTDQGVYQVTGAEAHDWEDIALGPGPGDVDHLYLADIGDNFTEPLRLDNPIKLYRLPEPAAGDGPGGGVTEPAATIHLAYEDGHRDAEALLADPLTGDLFVVSKQWDGTPAGVYRLPADVARAEPAPAEAVTLAREADVPETEGVFVTGGDISPDGTVVALRTYEGVRLWDRSPDETVAEALSRPADCDVPVDEPQGEAVGFTADGRGWVTISEGDHPPVNLNVLP